MKWPTTRFVMAGARALTYYLRELGVKMPDMRVGAEMERVADALEKLAAAQQMRSKAAMRQTDILNEFWKMLKPVLEEEIENG